MSERQGNSDVTGPKLHADFNGLFGDLLCLSHSDTALDAAGMTVTLHAGMSATAFDEDVDEFGRPDNLIVQGVVEASPGWLQCNGSKWVLRIDRNGVRHESELSRVASELE
jgi:hypothetical protein